MKPALLFASARFQDPIASRIVRSQIVPKEKRRSP